jgi:hypothetical protein
MTSPNMRRFTEPLTATQILGSNAGLVLFENAYDLRLGARDFLTARLLPAHALRVFHLF